MVLPHLVRIIWYRILRGSRWTDDKTTHARYATTRHRLRVADATTAGHRLRIDSLGVGYRIFIII